MSFKLRNIISITGLVFLSLMPPSAWASTIKTEVVEITTVPAGEDLLIQFHLASNSTDTNIKYSIQKMLSSLIDTEFLPTVEGRLVSLTRNDQKPLSVLAHFGMSSSAKIDRTLLGCFNSWYESLDRTQRLLLVGTIDNYPNSGTEQLTSDAKLLEAYIQLNHSACENAKLTVLDNEPEKEIFLTRIPSYLGHRALDPSGIRIAENDKPYHLLLGDAFQKVQQIAQDDLQKVKKSALLSWIQNIKNQSFDAGENISLDASFDALRKDGQQSPGKFAVNILLSIFRQQDLAASLGNSDYRLIDPASFLLDTLLQSCSNSSKKVDSTVCSTDQLSEEFIWTEFHTKSAGNFKILTPLVK
jgi:hypothetical protein